MNDITLLVILAGFSLNLVLQSGLGIREIYHDLDFPFRASLLRWALLFAVVFLFWLLWTFVFSPLSLGFFDAIFIFPFCAVVLRAADEHLAKQKFFAHFHQSGSSLASSTPFCMFALVMTLRLASSVFDAAFLSLFFAAGCALQSLILKAIHLRQQLEPARKSIAGIPFFYISCGLLALVCSGVAAILLK
jgi:Na+-translocating ferredoxin:NAD+ oxidoreductase RnfA subunit